MASPRYSNSYEAVVSLLREHPEWKGMIVAALEEAQTIKSGRFAGKWVLERARKYGVTWVPNLKKLVAYGILVKEGDSTQGGRRAYYAMPDPAGVEQALKDVNVSPVGAPYSGIRVTDAGVARRSTIRVPYYANLISCGSPNMSEEQADGHVEVDARIAQPGHQYFLVRAEGDSMNLAGINSGDLMLIRVQDYADIGQKVLACLADGTTVKEYQRSGDYAILMPRSTNPEHKPIVLSEDAMIQGVVLTTIPNLL